LLKAESKSKPYLFYTNLIGGDGGEKGGPGRVKIMEHHCTVRVP
jgi:hypothetical protein